MAYLLKLVQWLLALVGLGLLAGCVVHLKGNGEVGFKQATSWGFYHSTEIMDERQQADAELKSQPLLDYLAKEDADKPAP